MAQFKNKPISIEELMIWKREPLINPRSMRKIKENSKLYNYISAKYKSKFPNGIDIFDSVDERDPISLNRFYSIEGNKKTLVYQNVKNLILYYETDKIIRCFEKESLQYLKTYNMIEHPVSQRRIPDDVLKLVKKIEISTEITIDEKALQVFQLFTGISIFIDYKKFMELNINSLLKLNYELKDFYYQNFTNENRIKIDNDNGKKFFKLDNSDLDEKDIDTIRKYLLEEIENVLSYPDDDLKFMINYVVLGGLSLVMDEVKEIYDNFNFSF